MLYPSEARPIVAELIKESQSLLIQRVGKSKTHPLNLFRVYSVSKYGAPRNISGLISAVFADSYAPKDTCQMEGTLEIARGNLLDLLRDCQVEIEEASISVFALD